MHQRNQQQKKIRIRSRAKIREKLESQVVKPMDFDEIYVRMAVHLSEGEAVLKALKEAREALTNEDSEAKVIYLYQQLTNIFQCLNEMNEIYDQFSSETAAINMTAAAVETVLFFLNRTRTFLKNIHAMNDLLELTLVIDNDSATFFNQIYEAFRVMSVILLVAIRQTYIEQDPHFKNKIKSPGRPADDVIRPHLLETLLITQYLGHAFVAVLSDSDMDLAETKNEIQVNESLIQRHLKLIKSDAREFRAYELALKAQAEVDSHKPNFVNVRDYYKQASSLLAALDFVTLYGLDRLLAYVCSSLSLNHSDDSLTQVVIKRYWIKEALKWCDESNNKYTLYSQRLADSNSKLASHYYDTLTSLDNYSTCESYFEIENDNQKIKIVPTKYTTATHFLRLMQTLKEADIDFVGTDQNEIIFDCVNHYVPPQKLLLALTQFISRTEILENKPHDYHWITESLEKNTSETQGNLSCEKETTKKEENSGLNEKERKWQNHLAMEEERKFLKSQHTKIEITQNKEKEEKEEDKEEDFVLKGSLPGKQIACYHLSIDEKLEKIVPNEVLNNAKRIIKEPSRSFGGNQGIVFFKNGKGKDRKVIAKLKIGGGENVRLFANVTKLEKDSNGRKHFSVNFDIAEMKHRNKK